MGDSQAQHLAEKLPGPPASPKTGVKVLIPSELELTAEQEERLLSHAKTRLQELESDLGRTNFENQDWLTMPMLDVQQSATTFFGRRHLAHMIAQQRMEWRPLLLGGLYRESNLHLPLTARVITQQSARAQKSFFGTSPYFAVTGLSAASEEMAGDINAYARHMLENVGSITAGLETAVDLAFIQGESVVKTRKHKLISYFESFRTIALDSAGEPIIAQDGDYIYKTDQFIKEMGPQVDPATRQPVVDEAGNPVMVETGRMVLKRDGVTREPDTNTFQNVKVNLAKILADRVEARPIYYLDFLCPLDATDVQSADICIHLYNTSVIEMATKYLTDEHFGGQAPEEQIARVKGLVEELLPGSAEDRQAAGDRSRSELGETFQSHGRSRSEPTTACAECWMWFDPFGDGVMRSIMLLMDRNGRVPIYYGYTANLTDDGLRPLDVLRINPPAGRWHGQGNVERFWNLQIHADLLLNRSLYAESRAARVDFWKPSQTLEGEQNPNLQLNWGKTYTLKENARVEDVLKPVYLENIKSANLQNILQIIQQMIQNMSGVTSVNDGAMAGMDTAKLATGIKNLEASGEELFHAYITQLRPSIQSILKRALRMVIADALQNPNKVLKFFDRQSKQMMELDVLRLENLDFDIALELTTYKSQASLQQAQTAYTMVDAFLMRSPVIQARLAPMLKQALKALEWKDADKIAQPLSPEEYAMAFPPPPPEEGEGGTATATPMPI